MRSAPPLSVAIVPTGTANTASVRAAFTRLGVEARVVSDPSALGRAERVVLPGVGALEPAMDALRGKGIASLLTDRIEAGRCSDVRKSAIAVVCEESYRVVLDAAHEQEPVAVVVDHSRMAGNSR